MNYQYIVTVNEIFDPYQVKKLINYLLIVSSKIKSGDNLKVILDSPGGETNYMKKLLAILQSIKDKGCIIDVYCNKVISSSLILLVMLRDQKIVNKVYSYPNARFMWHEPEIYLEFSGNWEGDRFFVKGKFSKIITQIKETCKELTVFEEEYAEWKNLYLAIIQDAILKKVQEEMIEEIYFCPLTAKYRNLVDEIL